VLALPPPTLFPYTTLFRSLGARRRRRARAVRSRREPPGPPRGLRAVLVHAARLGAAGAEEVEATVDRSAVALLPQRARCDESLRDRKSTRLNSSHSQISYA